MRIYRDLEKLAPAAFRRPAVTLGVFDGVHRGHQALLARLREAADASGGDAVVVTFDRHPRAVVGGGAPPMITALEHRLALFERLGIDACVVLHFDERLAAIPAEGFVRDILIGRLGAAAVVLGPDAHFGRGREGSIVLLRRLAPELGYELTVVEPVLAPRRTSAGGAGAGGQGPADRGAAQASPPPTGEAPFVVSSTAIRAAIAEGRLDAARAMLGRPVSLLGRVVRGAERGRTIGFPTANLELHQEVCPPRGVYAGRVEIDGVVYPTMQNIGVRPTFTDAGQPAEREALEVHAIGFSGDLYGRVLDVQLLERLRDEQRFPSIEALRAQLERDREAALAVVGAPRPADGARAIDTPPERA